MKFPTFETCVIGPMASCGIGRTRPRIIITMIPMMNGSAILFRALTARTLPAVRSSSPPRLLERADPLPRPEPRAAPGQATVACSRPGRRPRAPPGLQLPQPMTHLGGDGAGEVAGSIAVELGDDVANHPGPPEVEGGDLLLVGNLRGGVGVAVHYRARALGWQR